MIIESLHQLEFRFYIKYLINGEYYFLQEAKRKGLIFVYEFKQE
jgi:hypothetical protein